MKETMNNTPEPKNDRQYLAWCIVGVVVVLGTVAEEAIKALKDLFNSDQDENNVA